MLHTPNHTMITVSDTKKYFALLGILSVIAIAVLIFIYVSSEKNREKSNASKEYSVTETKVQNTVRSLEISSQKQKNTLLDPVKDIKTKNTITVLSSSSKKESSLNEEEVKKAVDFLGGR